VYWDLEGWGYSIDDCVFALRKSDPCIEVLGADNPSMVPAVHEGIQKPTRKAPRPKIDHIELVSMTIQDGEEMIVGKRLRELLGEAQKKAKKA
jgi:L-seryl-tRNA(Ser) seleniumtransferase